IGSPSSEELESAAQRRGLIPGSAEHAPTSQYTIPGRNAFPLPGAIDPSIYRVGPGDVLLLQFWGRLTQSTPIEVGPEGTIMVPNGGTMRVDGLTLTEVKSQVLARLRGRFIGVNQDLRLARPRVFRVYLTG